tara:strand:+ start:4783 stop:5445 length:663 start_codon:yes stop_codon:yes gene_type:complete
LSTIYPEEILPSSDKKNILCDISNCLLFRHYIHNPLFIEFDEGDGYINQRYIADPTSRLSDLSTSLFGVFDLNAGKIGIVGEKKDYFNQYCKANEQVDFPQYKKDFVLNNNRSFWFVKVGNLHNDKTKYSSLNKNSKSFEASCRIVHSPMRWNYWHFSIRWYIQEDDGNSFWLDKLSNNKQAKYIKKISSLSRSILAKNIQREKHNKFDIIDEQDYLITA